MRGLKKLQTAHHIRYLSAPIFIFSFFLLKVSLRDLVIALHFLVSFVYNDNKGILFYSINLKYVYTVCMNKGKVPHLWSGGCTGPPQGCLCGSRLWGEAAHVLLMHLRSLSCRRHVSIAGQPSRCGW